MGNLQAQQWLYREDSICREDRLARLRWLAGLMPLAEHLSFPGGWIAKHLFEEARYCYVYGQFMAAIVLGMAYIEHTIAALFYGAGRSNLERAKISDLLREAVDHGYLNHAEFDKLDSARKWRNLIHHFRRPYSKGTIIYQSIIRNEMPYSILEEDARYVMRAVFRLLSRNTT